MCIGFLTGPEKLIEGHVLLLLPEKEEGGLVILMSGALGALPGPRCVRLAATCVISSSDLLALC